MLDTYLARNDNDADAHNIAGLAKRRLGRADDALSHLQRAVALNTTEPVYTVNLALLLGDMDRLDDALATLDALLLRHPGQADALIQRASLLRRAGRVDEAVSVARMAVAFHRTLAAAHQALGLALMKTADHAKAAEAFAEAGRLDGNLTETWINLGVALKETGDLKGAEAAYRRALTLAPHRRHHPQQSCQYAARGSERRRGHRQLLRGHNTRPRLCRCQSQSRPCVARHRRHGRSAFAARRRCG